MNNDIDPATLNSTETIETQNAGMKTISYVSAPAGSGKTFGLIQHAIAEIQTGKKILIAQPTKALIRQTELQLRAADPTATVTAIFQREQNQRVVLDVQSHIENAIPGDGEILLITHETLKRLNNANRKFWDLYVDEIPGVFNRTQLNIAKTHQHVTPYLAANELVPGITRLTVGQAARVDELIANETEDQNIATFKELLSFVRDPNRLVCITTDSYDDLLNNPETHGRMNFFSILTDDFVSGFGNVTFMGANAEATEMLTLWNAMLNVKFVPHPVLSKAIRYEQHDNGHRLKIGYLFDRWTKGAVDTGVEGDRALDHIQKFINRYMDDRRFIWQANAHVSDKLFDPWSRLPHHAHGLNEDSFMSSHNVVLLSALNHSDASYTFLKLIGVEREAADTMLHYQSDYQAMMRCSLRDPKAIAPVEVIVATKGSAEWLANLFPGCSVGALEHQITPPKKRGPVRKAKTLSGADNVHNSRERKKASEAAARGEVYVPKLRTLS